MKKLILLIFIFTSRIVSGQCGVDWLKHTEGDAETQFYGLLSDSSNNILAWGERDYGSTGFNYGNITIAGQGGQTGILLKTDNNGNELWANSFSSGSNYCSVISAVTNSNDEIYALVYGWGALVLDGYGSISPVANDYYVSVVKMSAAGDYIWHQTLSSTSSLRIYDINQINDRLFVVGTFRENLTMNDSTYYTAIVPGSPNYDFFMTKLDTSGNVLNSRFFATDGNEEVCNFSMGGNGDLIVTTSSNASNLSIDGNVLNNTLGGYNNVIASFDSSNFSSNWVKYIYNNPNYAYRSFTKDNDIYVVGGFANGNTFPPNALNPTSGTSGAFIAKMDLVGNVVWAKTSSASSYGNMIINDVAITSGFIYTSMFLRDSFYFNNTYAGNTGNSGYYSMAFVKYDLNGDYVSHILASDSSSICYADGIAFNSDGDMIVSGHFRNEFNFNGYDIQFSNPASNLGYGWNEMIAKMCPDFSIGLPTEKEAVLLEIYPNPVKDKISVNLSSERKVSEVRVVDSYGRTRILIKSFMSQKEIDVSFLENSFYVLKVLFDNGDQTSAKFVKMEN